MAAGKHPPTQVEKKRPERRLFLNKFLCDLRAEIFWKSAPGPPRPLNNQKNQHLPRKTFVFNETTLARKWKKTPLSRKIQIIINITSTAINREWYAVFIFHTPLTPNAHFCPGLHPKVKTAREVSKNGPREAPPPTSWKKEAREDIFS